MTTFIRKSRRITETFHVLRFENPEVRGAGWAFMCDANGTLTEKLTGEALDNYRMCISTLRGEIVERTNNYVRPAIIRCNCGCHVTLDRFTNTCDCGADYNLSGQLLAPRSQWGSETGETATETMMA